MAECATHWSYSLMTIARSRQSSHFRVTLFHQSNLNKLSLTQMTSQTLCSACNQVNQPLRRGLCIMSAVHTYRSLPMRSWHRRQEFDVKRAVMTPTTQRTTSGRSDATTRTQRKYLNTHAIKLPGGMLYICFYVRS